jgi:ribosomal protein S18 acetylase RimI-like enzyme
MDYIIRNAVDKDAADLGYVHYCSWIQTYTGLINQAYLNRLSIAKSIAMYQKTACQNHIVLEVEGEIVGFVAINKTRDLDLNDYGEIQALYLLKKYQGLGYGKKLLEAGLTELKNRGFNDISLWVLDTNTKAISFYQKQGFVYDGHTKVGIPKYPITEKRYLIKI